MFKSLKLSLNARVSQNMHQESFQLHQFNTKLLKSTDQYANFQFSVVIMRYCLLKNIKVANLNQRS